METEMEKQKLAVYALQGAEGGLLTIDLNNGEICESPYGLRDTCESLNSAVVVGSAVYVVGKPFDFRSDPKEKKNCLKHKGVSYIDTKEGSSSSQGWKAVPFPRRVKDVIFPSYAPALVVFDGKLYVFPTDYACTTAAVFDTETNTWETLLPPRGHNHFLIYHPTGAMLDPDPDSNRILLQLEFSLFAYYPDRKLWKLVAQDVFWREDQVFAKGMLFQDTGSRASVVNVYDVFDGKYLNIVVTSDSEVGYNKVLLHKHFGRNGVYLGNGVFAVCFKDALPGIGPSPSVVSVAKFRFERSSESPSDILFTLLSFQDYPLVDCYSYLAFMPMD